MQNVRMVSLVAAATLVLLCGCNGDDVIELTVSDHGSTVQMSLGQTLEISLDENPSTGYAWQIDSVDATLLEFLNRTFQLDPECPPDAMGCGGTATLQFESNGTGESLLRLVYRRSWETGSAATFEVTVVVD